MRTKENFFAVSTGFAIALLSVGVVITFLIIESRKEAKNDVIDWGVNVDDDIVITNTVVNTNSNPPELPQRPAEIVAIKPLTLTDPSRATSFEDRFSSPLAESWAQVNGTWDVIDGALTTSSALEHNYLFLTGDGHTYKDFELTADVLVKKNQYHHPAVTFRAQDANNHYIVRVNQWSSRTWDSLQLYKKAWSSDRLDDEGWTLLDGQRLNTFAGSDQLKEEVWYTMRIRAQGDAIQAKIWERESTEPLDWNITVKDATYASGAIGLEYFNGAHKFDNLVITPLQ